MQGRRWLVAFAARGQCRAASRERVGHGSHGRAGRAGLPPATSRQRGRASTLSLNPERGGGPAEAARAGGGFSGCAASLLRFARAARLGSRPIVCARELTRVKILYMSHVRAAAHNHTSSVFPTRNHGRRPPPHRETGASCTRDGRGWGPSHTHSPSLPLPAKSQVLLPAKGLRKTQTPERGGSRCLTSRPSPPDRLGPPRACRARR